MSDRIGLDEYQGDIECRDECLHVDLWYPGCGKGSVNAIEISLMHVRASDGIRIEYDMSRDGWVVKQPKGYWKDEEKTEYAEEWVETAFVQSWPFGNEFAGAFE